MLLSPRAIKIRVEATTSQSDAQTRRQEHYSAVEDKKYRHVLPWGRCCLYTSDWIQPIRDKGSVVQVQLRLNPASQVWALYWSFRLVYFGPLWASVDITFFLLLLAVCQHYRQQPWLLHPDQRLFCLDACCAPRPLGTVILKWLILTVCLLSNNLHKSPVVWQVIFTCSFTRLYPRGRQRRTGWVMKHTRG